MTRAWLAALGALALCGCASMPPGEGVAHDPWEKTNRKVYAFNDAVDRATLKPIARAYNKVLPQPLRTGVSNFSQNLLTPRSAINSFLQGKVDDGAEELSRFFFNSIFGIGGLIDVAKHAGLEAHNEDFGQTAAVWGVPAGPYVTLPFLGPQTLRDTVFLPLDMLADPLYHYDETSVRDKVTVLRIINLRARLLSFEDLLKDSQDPYVTMRESFLQNRRFEVYDGNPPLEDDDEFYDEFLEEEDY